MAKNASAKNYSVLWWILWITATIASFFAASAFWTPWIASRYGSVRETGPAMLWVAAVFGTWLLFLLPLIIVMYRKVDKAYEDARIRREQASMRFRSLHIERSRRLLSPEISRKIRSWPETIPGGHLVHVHLKNGGKISNVFVSDGEEILGLYDQTVLPFTPDDIQDVEAVDMSRPPFFIQAKWLRLDGATLPLS